MNYSFVESNGFSIAYVEKNHDASRTIVFIHGNSGDLHTWTCQLNSSMLKDSRLLALELPGHGHSSDSKGNFIEDYNPVATGWIMADALKQLLKGQPFILVGFSYGSNVVTEMLNYDLLPAGIVFNGACVVGNGIGVGDVLYEPEKSIYLKDQVTREEAEEFIKARLCSGDSKILEMYVNGYMGTRIPFRSTLLQAAIENRVSNEIGILIEKNIPLLLIFGEKDSLVKTGYLNNAALPLWKNKIFRLAESGHYIQTDVPGEFHELLLDYAEDRF